MKRVMPYVATAIICGLMSFTLVQVYGNRSRIDAFEQRTNVAREKAIAQLAAENAETLDHIRRVLKHQRGDLRKILGSLRVILRFLGGQGSDIPPRNSTDTSVPSKSRETRKPTRSKQADDSPGRSDPRGRAKGHKRGTDDPEICLLEVFCF